MNRIEKPAEPPEWRGGVRTLAKDERDLDGRLLKGGTKVLAHPGQPEAFRDDNPDKLEALKDEIRKLEHRAVQKKKEADSARGDIKRMVVREIEQIFRDLDRLRGRENISPERASVDVSQRVGELEGAKETATELSDTTLKRLKELEEG